MELRLNLLEDGDKMKWNLNILITQTKKITIHDAPFNRTLNIDFDKAIYNWIDFNSSIGNTISAWAIGMEIIKKDPKKKIKSQNHSYLYI